ncbi:MAG: hypothetical protein K2N84_01355, partial [Clostridia bacterium]|nr:hypothetical protein [Clostridia bacterium]
GPKTCGGTGVGDDGTIYTDVFSTEYTGWSTPGQYPIRIYSDSNGGKSFSTIHDAGTYTLANYDGGPIRAYTWLYNASVRIVVKPKEVKINFKTGQKVTYGYNATELDTRLSSTAAGEIMYEVDANTPLVGSDTIASLGITVKHSYGTDAGKNYTMIASLPTATKYGYAVSNCANPNYTVVFGNRAGTFEIEPRPVTVILNDDYGTYGDSTTNKKLQQSETTDAEINGTSSILATAKNDSTRYKATDNTTDVTIASPATGVKADAYKGGWYYSTDIGGGKASQEFLTFDISNRFPFKYEFGFTASSDVWSGDSDKWLLAKDYYVTVTTANPNYTVTYQNAQDSTKSNTFKYTVRKAEITVDETSLPKTDGVSSYRISEYDNTKKTITFPSAAVIRKGAYTSPVPATLPSELKFDVTFWGTTFSDEQVAATDFKTKTEPKATDTGWTSTMPTIKDAGKYHVYVKIHVENHNDKVYDVIYTVKPQELDYEIQFWRKPKAGDAEQKLEKKSGAYSEQYNGQAITAKVEIVWNAPATKPSYYDTDPGRPVFTFYYKGTGTNTYGTAANTDFPDNSGKKPDGTTYWNLGNSNAPVNGGGYTASFVETPNKNYVVKTGGGRVRAESFTIEQREVDAPTAPTGTYYYNSTVQTITVPKFDADAMEFIEDTTNKYVVEPDPVPATHPVDDGTSALTFDKDAKAVKVKNAGDYKIKFKIKDTANYKWSDGGTDANREVTITVKGAPIKSTWTNDLDGMPWVWEAGAQAVHRHDAREYQNGTA